MVYTARFWYSKEPLTTDINSLNKFQCGEEVLRDITENGKLNKAKSAKPFYIYLFKIFRNYLQS